MSTTIKERVKVIAVFEGGLTPVKFRWRGRLYAIKDVTFRWASKDGADAIQHFSVTDGATLFELAYNQTTMAWSVEEVD